MNDFLEHCGYVSCDYFHTVDSEGFLTTTEDNQIIKFTKDNNTIILNSIRFFTKDTPIAVKFNNSDRGIFRLGINDSDGLDKVQVTQIQILCPTGTKLRYDGFYM